MIGILEMEKDYKEVVCNLWMNIQAKELLMAFTFPEEV